MEPLAFYEYCRFDTSAFFWVIKRASHGTIVADFLKNVLIFEEKVVADFFPGLYGALYGQSRISHTNLKNRMVISGIATSKNPRSDLRPDS
jgi:hypothetical protein